MKIHPVGEIRPDFEEVYRKYKNLLTPLRQRYIEQVSEDSMAMSLEGAALVCAVAEIEKFTNVLDLGSGFGSAAFRLGIASAEVASVDTSVEWLARTEEFLEQEKLVSGKFRSWEEQMNLKHTYQLVVHDAGDLGFRQRTLPQVRLCARLHGYYVFDDMHVVAYHREVEQMLSTRPVYVYDVEKLTADGFGRYVWLVKRMG